MPESASTDPFLPLIELERTPAASGVDVATLSVMAEAESLSAGLDSRRKTLIARPFNQTRPFKASAVEFATAELTFGGAVDAG